MKVLVIGSGGREHAICWKLRQSPKVRELYCAPGNGGIAAVATCIPIKATDIDMVTAWAVAHKMDFVVVAPDDPLALGLVDALEEAGIAAFGPRKNAAIIEASKIFSKELMEKYNIPTAAYQSFTDCTAALSYLETAPLPIVVKADGLALGKGVVVAQSREDAIIAVREMMEDNRFGASGSRVVIEECMTGPEVTVLAFADGKTVVPMLSSQDHKRAFDGDQGPNTGGMGAICPSPHDSVALMAQCQREIFQPTMAALIAEGRPFSGVIYFGLMLTPNGPKVIEYNARFGDPECQAVLSLLESDLLDIMLACRNGTLDQQEIRWSAGAACCLVLASGGYPGSYQTGYPITGLERGGMLATVFHAGTRQDGTNLVTNGGRVLGVTATGETLAAAVATAYQSAAHITFPHIHFRHDIGQV